MARSKKLNDDQLWNILGVLNTVGSAFNLSEVMNESLPDEYIDNDIDELAEALSDMCAAIANADEAAHRVRRQLAAYGIDPGSSRKR